MIQEIFFLKNHKQNVLEKLVPGTFLKYPNQANIWIIRLKFYGLLSLYVQVEDYQIILKLRP